MTQCMLCNYFEPITEETRERSGHVCAVCAVRTTPEQRMELLRGRRIDLCYMDSD
ncbi:MAG TPA: hypothetical protein VFA70_03910 [Dehalococcoidia bacterium]|nr:hypothetical protein [Dehalococcoidia bacterium]